MKTDDLLLKHDGCTRCIIGGSALAAGNIVKLDWRIVMRDGTSYMLALLVSMKFVVFSAYNSSFFRPILVQIRFYITCGDQCTQLQKVVHITTRIFIVMYTSSAKTPKMSRKRVILGLL